MLYKLTFWAVLDGVPGDKVSGEEPISLYGVFGYPSIEAHMKWRETPESIMAQGGDEPLESQEPNYVAHYQYLLF